ncbi:hypothetical protein J4221_03585 [Candidatus Pacearchaeota archaeon]|nr:hypothetical protein [Candidatus Pacearchaeota archaeon]
MDSDKNYGGSYVELEASIRDRYRDGLMRLSETNNSHEQLEIIKGIFEDLGKSRPFFGRGIEWARDVILAYRNLGERLLGERLKMVASEDIKSASEDMENFAAYDTLLEEYDGDNRNDKIKIALDELFRLKRILDFHYIDVDSLDKKLEFTDSIRDYVDYESLDKLLELADRIKSLDYL